MEKPIASIEFEGDETPALERFKKIVRNVNGDACDRFLPILPHPQKRPLNEISYYSYNRSFGLDLDRQGEKWLIHAIPFCLLDNRLISYIERTVGDN